MGADLSENRKPLLTRLHTFTIFMLMPKKQPRRFSMLLPDGWDKALEEYRKLESLRSAAAAIVHIVGPKLKAKGLISK